MDNYKLKNLDQISSSTLTSLVSNANLLANQTEEMKRIFGNSRLTDAFGKIPSQTEEMKRIFGNSRLTDAFGRIPSQTEEMKRIFGNSIQTDPLRQIIREQSEEIQRRLGTSRFADITNQIEKRYSLVRTFKIETLVNSSLTRFTHEEVGKSIFLPNDLRVSLLRNFDDLSSAYSSLAKLRDSEVFSNIPSKIILEQPALEILESVSLIEVISDNNLDEQIEAEKSYSRSEILISLGGLDQLLTNIGTEDLVPMWRGAIEALESGHTDYARHCSVSLRELLTHVLHRLAPDDEIKKWTNESEYFDKGKPTRKARLLFICRSINNDVFTDFISKDINATVEFFNLFQRGTHQAILPFTHKQLLTLKNKVESTISFLIETWRLNNE